MASTTLTTSDTDFASAMMAKGARLVSWEPSKDQARARMMWMLDGIEPEWIEEYRSGKDKFAAFVHAHRMLVNIAKTDERMK